MVEKEKNLVLFKVTKIENNHFKREKGLAKYITDNMIKFCRDILEDELVSFEEEYQFSGVQKFMFGPRNTRVDLFITCKKYKYLVELKNPKYLSENRAAIGQLLSYGCEYLDPKKRLVLITTKFDAKTARVIKQYNLPIRYIYLEKGKSLEFEGFENDSSS